MNEEFPFIGALKAIAMTSEETAAMEQQLHAFMARCHVRECGTGCHTYMDEETLIGTLHNIRMTVAETERMHATLPVLASQQSALSTALRFFLRPTAVLTSFLIASIGMGTISYAAESALPGDALYPFKIHINEAIHERLIFSVEAKALYGAEKAEKRLEEAEALDAQGRLSPEGRTALMKTFHERMRQSQEDMRLLRASNPEAAAELQKRIGTLRGHALMLNILEEHTGEEERSPNTSNVHASASSTSQTASSIQAENHGRSNQTPAASHRANMQ